MKGMAWLRRFPLFLFATAWPWLAAAPNHLFVFEKGALEANVYDASSLNLATSLTVGWGAIGAFSVTRPDNGEPEKFLVVSENGVSIFNADFSPRGTLFLPTSGFPTAAAISHDRNVLAIAAGEVLFLIDTSSESILAEIELGFAATGLAMRGDRRRVYLISSQSRHVRVVDIDKAALRETALLLAERPGTITTAADGSRVYVTTRGAIYALDERAERFFTPLLSSSRAEAMGDFPVHPTSGDQPLIDRLVVTARGRFFLRSGEKLLRGVLGSAGTTAEPVLPPDAIPGGLADLAASPDGRLLSFLTRAGKLVQWDTAAGAPTAEIVLASSPDGISLTTPPIAVDPDFQFDV